MKRGFQLIKRKPATSVSPVMGLEKLQPFVDKNQWGTIRAALQKEFSRERASIVILHAGLGSNNIWDADDLLVLKVDYGHGFRSHSKAGRKRVKCSLPTAIGRGIFAPWGVEYRKVRNKRRQVI